jgi:hypothetical protein
MVFLPGCTCSYLTTLGRNSVLPLMFQLFQLF